MDINYTLPHTGHMQMGRMEMVLMSCAECGCDSGSEKDKEESNPTGAPEGQKSSVCKRLDVGLGQSIAHTLTLIRIDILINYRGRALHQQNLSRVHRSTVRLHKWL